MTDSEDHLPDPHEDQHVADLSPWVAERFLDLLARYGQTMYQAGVEAAKRHPTPACSDLADVHRSAAAPLKQLLGVENPDHG